MTNVYVNELRKNIDALAAMGNKLMPTILRDGDDSPNNGKVPTLIRPNGTTAHITGRDGWTAADLYGQIELGNKHGLMVGIAIQPPEDLVIIDLDVQNYQGGQEELWSDYEQMVKAAPMLSETRTERTRNGGLHIYVRVKNLSAWRKPDGQLRKILYRAKDGGNKRGELLSANSICVAAPSYERYTVLDNRPADKVITIESLDQIGIYPQVKNPTKINPTATTQTTNSRSNVRLRDLLGLKAAKVLLGQYAYTDTNSGKNDRSLQLVGFAKEAYGCENMAIQYGAVLSESAEELIDIVVNKFNLNDKSDRILASIDDERSNFTPSRPGFIRQKLGIGTNHGGRKPNITGDIVEAELMKVYGQIRERIRSGDVELGNGSVKDRDSISLIYIDLCKNTPYQWNQGLAKDAVLKLARENRYDHIKEHFTQLVANATPLSDDKWHRLDQLLFGIDDPIAAMFMPKYLIGAVNRLMNPGCDCVPTPILIGGQGIGKSESAKVLFGHDFVVDDLGHDMTKDDISRAHGFFCTELSEVDGITSKADRERFKAFLTRKVDTYRPPYGANNINRKRSFVFWGTSNGIPLNDPSGNRRFVAIDLRSKSKENRIPLPQIAKYRAAIWARAFKEFYASTPYTLDPTEQDLINGNNDLFTCSDSWADRLAEKLAHDHRHTCLTVADGFQILDIQPAQQTQANQKRMREVLESLGYQSAKVTLDDGRRVCRLTRKKGGKQIPVNLSTCLSFHSP